MASVQFGRKYGGSGVAPRFSPVTPPSPCPSPPTKSSQPCGARLSPSISSCHCNEGHGGSQAPEQRLVPPWGGYGEGAARFSLWSRRGSAGAVNFCQSLNTSPWFSISGGDGCIQRGALPGGAPTSPRSHL